MALIQCDFYSNVLGISSSMNVILPFDGGIGISSSDNKTSFSLLYLLHGLTDDHTMWCRRTSIERYSSKYRTAVIMPNAGRSFYTDMAFGNKYWTFISEELPEIVSSLFHIPSEPSHSFVAGLSMGGYGALKLAFHYPDRFKAAASLSGVVDITDFASCDPLHLGDELARIFGPVESIGGSENDLYSLLQASSPKQTPSLYISCGKRDFLIDATRRFKQTLEKKSIPVSYSEIDKAGHNWELWDSEIQNALRFFFKEKHND